MTNDEAIEELKKVDTLDMPARLCEAHYMSIKALETIPKYKDAYNKGWDDGAKASYEHLKMCEEEQEISGDLISRDAVIDITWEEPSYTDALNVLTEVRDKVKALPSVNPQEPKTGQYEKHIDHTDCIWYGSDSGCPVTCSQYRDGWNDAMDYIYKGGKGYQQLGRTLKIIL